MSSTRSTSRNPASAATRSASSTDTPGTTRAVFARGIGTPFKRAAETTAKKPPERDQARSCSTVISEIHRWMA